MAIYRSISHTIFFDTVDLWNTSGIFGNNTGTVRWSRMHFCVQHQSVFQGYEQFISYYCINQYPSSGLIYSVFTGAGYATIILNVIAVTYFASIMSYPILYIYHSFSSPLPWQACGNSWNTEKCTEVS